MKARYLASELAVGIFRLYTGDMSPAQLAEQLPIDNNNPPQQPQQQSQQKEMVPPPPFSSEDTGFEKEDEEKDEKDNSNQSRDLGQTKNPNNTVKPIATEPKVCDPNGMPKVQRINGLRVILAPLEDRYMYDPQQIQDGYCYRYVDGKKVRIDLSDIKRMKE